MIREEKKLIKKDIKWLKRAIKLFDHGNICYCWCKPDEFPAMEIAARYLICKGFPLKLSYGTAKFSRDVYISIL